MAKQNKRTTGTQYEQEAANYLISKGIQILEKNYRSGRYGEIDLIGTDGTYLIFIEVKYRKTISMGDPAESVKPEKQHRIRQVAQSYLYTNHCPADTPCRFDVVAILGTELRWIPNAF